VERLTIKPIRKVIGSITGEEWETRAAGIPRRRLPDGRTETGKPIPEPEVEKADEPQEIEIQIPDEEGLVWERPNQGIDFDVQKIQIEELPEPEPIRKRQAPKSSKKDLDKMQDLALGIGAIFDNQTYSGEEKALIISKLFAGTTDVRIETSQYVMSSRVYGFLAGTTALLLMLKGSGGLFQNYGKMFQGFGGPKQTKVTDPFGEDDQNRN
tara:strand:- start:690 stop:1322 length:633 start_codon:yes stop_codon:yes gene_type:complete